MQIKSVEFLREPKRQSIQQLMGFASEKKNLKTFWELWWHAFLVTLRRKQLSLHWYIEYENGQAKQKWW